MTGEKRTGRPHALALFSGGLDSTLAILLIQRQNINVTAVGFKTQFWGRYVDDPSSTLPQHPTAQKFGFALKRVHLDKKFIDIVLNPKFGYGKNMNPCVDCKILMLREAKALSEEIGADFIITGEVLGQRPFSQLRDKIHLIEREAGLKGKLLRPLSAKLLPPTEAEVKGLVDREQLENISGRSRKRQMELACEFGLEDYPSPAGGCLLTDKSYANRLRDLIKHTGSLTPDDPDLIRFGRHIRLDDRTKIIVGKNEQDNDHLETLKREHHYVIEAKDIGSPLTLLIGEPSEENLRKAAMITARYSATKHQPEVCVTVERMSDGTIQEFTVAPTSPADLGAILLR